MKRILAMILAVAMLLLVCSCGSDTADNSSAVDPASCEHDWMDATCTTPEKCKICGTESGRANEHEFYNRVCANCDAVISDDEVLDLGDVMIMGDSITTFEGYSYELNQFWYHAGGREDNMTDVTDISETYWDILMSNCEGRLVRNQSCSGSTFVEARYKGGEFEKAYNSFWDRLNRYLLQENFFEGKSIDTFIFFGGTNDNNSCAIGEIMYEGWTEDDLKYFAPAYAHYIYQVKKVCPDAEIYSIVDTTLAQVADVMKEINEHYAVNTIEIDGFDEIAPHPTVKGMKEIERVLRKELKSVS